MPQLDLDDEPVAAESNRAPDRTALGAFVWGATTAICAGGVWAVTLLVAAWLGHPLVGTESTTRAALHAGFVIALLTVVGGTIGFVLGWMRDRYGRGGALALGIVGATFAVVGSLSAIAGWAAVDGLHPMLSSSLGWASVGFITGVTGYAFSRRLIHPEPKDDEDEPSVPAPRIEWLLRETKRRLRNPALVRVLPVLAVSAGAFVGAALVAPSDVWLALVAISALGLSVARVLYKQEERLRVLERRFGRRD